MITCAECRREPFALVDVFFEMKPGRDGLAYHLCLRCYSAPLKAEKALHPSAQQAVGKEKR